jgi:hypothetical protein
LFLRSSSTKKPLLGLFILDYLMISKILWKLDQFRLKVLGIALRPRFIISPFENKNVEVHVVTLSDINYNVIEAKDARLYTNKTNNITLIVKGGIEPLTSWHCEGCDDLPAAKNKVLTGELGIDRLPNIINSTVAVLLCGQVGHYNYFHWLYDVLPRLQLMESVIGKNERVKYLFPQLSLPFQRESIDILGIGINETFESTDCNFIQAKKIITTTHPIHTSWEPPEWTIDFVRSRFLPAASNASAGSRIYITRGDSSNGRVLLNESKLIQVLEHLRFQSITLSKLSLSDQIAIFSQAQIIVGVHGAGFTNLSFCAPGTRVFELTCEQYLNPIFETISDHLNLEHNYIFCEVPHPQGSPMTYNLLIGDDQIERLQSALISL